jgi:hypothetical protein
MAKTIHRRWLRFSLRTLLVVVTLVCVWLAWQVSIVHSRRALLEHVTQRGGSYQFVADYNPFEAADRTPRELSYLRRVLRDELVGSIVLPGESTAGEIEEMRRAFPEALVATMSE